MSTRFTPLARVVALAWICLAAPRVASALPEDPGSLAFHKSTQTAPLDGKSVTFDLYVPVMVGPGPIVALGHGFARNRGHFVGWGEQLARRGYVVAIPDFPGTLPDHAANSRVLAGLLGWMAQEGARTGSALFGKVDATRRAVVGHSAGGLAALLAASIDVSIGLVVGLDPVDRDEQGKKAAAVVKAPVLFLRAEPSTCNQQGNSAGIYQALPGAKLDLKVLGASHCDAESNTNAVCTVPCGGSSTARHTTFVRYAFAAMDYLLRCQSALLPWLGGAESKTDPGITELTSQSFPPAPLPCGAPVRDGGAAGDGRRPGDGGASRDGSRDGGVLPDQRLADGGRTDGALPDGALPAGGDGAGQGSSGCDCALASSRRLPGGALLAALALLALLARRRPRGPRHATPAARRD